MASSGPIGQQKWAFVPRAEIYNGEAPSFAGMIHVVEKEYAWVAFENTLKIYDARTSNLVAEYEFFDESKLECTISYVTSAKINGIPHLVLSTHNTSDLSQIRILDLRILRIEGIFIIPYNVSVMTYFERSEQYPVGRSDLFNKFKDIFAIGVKGGRVLIVDLYHTGKSVQRTLFPVDITSHDHHEFFSLEERKNTHPFVQLNDEYHNRGHVSIYPAADKKEYGKYFPDINDLIPIASKLIQVTAVSYIPQIRAIAVGFSIGCFQFYSASHLELVFSSPNEYEKKADSVRNSPISHFLYQELPDDEYGYLWVARGSVPSAKLYQPNKVDQVPSILLHLLRFKDDVGDRMRASDEDDDMDTEEDSVLKNINNLHQIGTKGMDVTKYTPRAPGRVIHCAILCDTNTNKEEYLRGETNLVETRQTRALFLWESAGKYHMEVLDIGRMEKFLEKSDIALERIMLDPTIVQSLPLHTVPADLPILSAWINLKTVMDFTPARSVGLDDNLVGGMESASRISIAPSFEIKFVYYDSILMFSFLNSQQQALWEFTRAGAIALQEPAEYHRLCERAGLLASINHLPNRDETTSQRHQLLCLALQYNLVSTVCVYIKKMDSENTFVLTNPKPVFDWAWESFLKLSNFLNNLFFNQQRNLFQAAEISDTERAQLLWDLGEVSVRLQDLYSVFEALIAREENWNEAAAETVDTLRARQDKITSAGQRLQVLTWLVQSEVLPPTDENQFANMFGELYNSYEGYRADRADKFNANNWKVQNMQGIRLVADAAKSSALFIDILVERAKKAMKRVATFEEEEMQMDDEQWEKPDLEAYPSMDLQQLILSHKDPESVLTTRSLILYFLYDLLDFSSISNTELADQFAATTMLTVAHRKMIHAFWILDRLSAPQYGVLADRLADALKLLLEANELEAWTSKILRTFWDYGGYAQGLSFYRAYFATPATPPYTLSIDDAMTCVNILLANGFVQEAMEFQRSFVSRWEEEGEGRTGRNKKIQWLLFHVLRHSIENKNTIQKLFQLHFNDLEDQCMQHFLAYHSLTTVAPYINEVPVLIFYLLRRSRHTEALACYEKLRAERPDIDTPYLTTLIEGIRMTLPRVHAHPTQSRLFPYMELSASQQFLTQRTLPQKDASLFNSFARPELAPGEVLYVPGRQTRVATKPRPTPAKKQHTTSVPLSSATPSSQYQNSLPATPAAQSALLATPPRSALAAPGRTPFARKGISFSDDPAEEDAPVVSTPASSVFGPQDTPQQSVKFGEDESVFKNTSAIRAPSAMRQATPVRSALRTPVPALETVAPSSAKRSVKFAEEDEYEEDEDDEEEEEEAEVEVEKKPKRASISFSLPDEKDTNKIDLDDDEEMEDEEEIGEDEDDEEIDDEEEVDSEEEEEEERRIVDVDEDEDEYEKEVEGQRVADYEDDEDDNEEQEREGQLASIGREHEEDEEEGEREMEEKVGRDIEETPKRRANVSFNIPEDEEGEEEADESEKSQNNLEESTNSEEEDDDEEEDKENEVEGYYDKVPPRGRTKTRPSPKVPSKGYPVELDVVGSDSEEEKEKEQGEDEEMKDQHDDEEEEEDEEGEEDEEDEEKENEGELEDDSEEQLSDRSAEEDSRQRGEPQVIDLDDDDTDDDASREDSMDASTDNQQQRREEEEKIEDERQEETRSPESSASASPLRSPSLSPEPSQPEPDRAEPEHPEPELESEPEREQEIEPEREQINESESEDDSVLESNPALEPQKPAEPEPEHKSSEPESEEDSESEPKQAQVEPELEREDESEPEEREPQTEREEEREAEREETMGEPEPEESDSEPEPEPEPIVEDNTQKEVEPEESEEQEPIQAKVNEDEREEMEESPNSSPEAPLDLNAPADSDEKEDVEMKGEEGERVEEVETKEVDKEDEDKDDKEEDKEEEKEQEKVKDSVESKEQEEEGKEEREAEKQEQEEKEKDELPEKGFEDGLEVGLEEEKETTNHDGKQNGTKSEQNHDKDSEMSEGEQERVLAEVREKEIKEQEAMDQVVQEHEEEEKKKEKGKGKGKGKKSEEVVEEETPRRRGRPRKSTATPATNTTTTTTTTTTTSEEESEEEPEQVAPLGVALPARRAKLVAAHNIHGAFPRKKNDSEDTPTPKKAATPAKKSTPAKPRSSRK